MVSFAIDGIVQAEYAYNWRGQQVIHSVYGPLGNRIAEFDEATGALIRDYVWFGMMPIAVIEGRELSSATRAPPKPPPTPKEKRRPGGRRFP